LNSEKNTFHDRQQLGTAILFSLRVMRLSGTQIHTNRVHIFNVYKILNSGETD